jgi:hypothetical protein
VTAAAAPAPPLHHRGEIESQLRAHHVIVAFAAGLIVLAVATLVAVILLKPAHARPPCAFGQPCPPPQGAPRALRGTVWKSSAGPQVEYDADTWSPASKKGDSIIFEGVNIDGLLYVITSKSTDYRSLYRDELGSLKDKFNLVESHSAARTLLGPNVGYQPGIGADFCGNVTSDQGGTIPVDTIAMAASKDGVSAFFALVTTDCSKTNNDQKTPFYADDLRAGDTLLNTFRWPSEIR